MASKAFPIRRYAAECLGTFLLTFAVSASLSLDYGVPTPIVAGLTLMIVVYLFGSISGAHVNPGVTFGLFTLKKLNFNETLSYIIAQLLGAFIASLILMKMVDPLSLSPGAAGEGIVGELIGTFVLAFAVTSVATKRIDASASGLVVGFSLFLGIALASAGSLGIINPAVALGLGVFDPASGMLGTNALVYALMPLFGGLLGAQASAWFAGKS